MKPSQPTVNCVDVSVPSFQKRLRSLKFQVFQIIRTMKVMTTYRSTQLF